VYKKENVNKVLGDLPPPPRMCVWSCSQLLYSSLPPLNFLLSFKHLPLITKSYSDLEVLVELHDTYIYVYCRNVTVRGKGKVVPVLN
jgi:hypothetical protein